jgi:hypothetical protein
MATSVQINAIADIILKVFGGDATAFETAMKEIMENTEKVTLDNKIAELRKQQQAANEDFEAQIQALLGLK